MLSRAVLNQILTYLKSQVDNGWSLEGRKKKTKRKAFLKVLFLIKSNYLICVFGSKSFNFKGPFASLATAEY